MPDDPGAAALARRAHERGIRVRGYGSADQAEAGDVPVAGQLRDWQFKDTGATAQIQLAGRARRGPCGCRYRAGIWP